MNPKAYRLPTHVLPRHYDIALEARLGDERFGGHVAIQLELTAPTATIELHARDLRIADAQVQFTAQGRAQSLGGTVTLDAERELAVIQLAEPIAAGLATLDLDFTGKVSGGLEGLFLSKDGQDELLCTQCEATGAHAIFPCFDEPTFKARFTWQVTTAPGATVLTNGRLVAAEMTADGSARTWTFAPTAPISTYLVALVIGDLASTPDQLVAGVPLRIWALKGKEHLGQFALDYTARLLPFYEDYFATPYHFAKLDQVGVPTFGAGAMENAGLIVSQQIALLLDPRTASRRQEILVASVIAHEFAHMWFGDLVTMTWWDDLWLNEAFASWMASHALDALSPHYHIWDETQGGLDRALATDALASTHAIYNPVETPRAIEENFDAITYEKGGAVLRMVHDFLGDEAFRAGLRTYMREFAEGNAAGADLWRHLQQASHQPVAQMMESWILQAGHPLLQIALEESGTTTHLRLSQRRFFAGLRAPANDQVWQVPLVIRYEDSAGQHETRYLLAERSASLPLNVSGELLWCYPNASEVGFYRQQLDATLRERLLAHLDQLTTAERKGLLRDQWALVANGSLPISAYLDVLGALAHGDDPTLIGQIVMDHLRRVEDLLEVAGDAPAQASFRSWTGGLFGERMRTLGFEPRADEPEATAQLRARVLSAMTRYAHDPQAIEQARAGQEREAADPAAVDANLAPVFVAATAQFGDTATYERYLGIYQRRKAGGYTPQQVERYIDVFARFEQPDLATRTLELLLGDFFPFQGVLQVAGPMIAQPRTQVAAWETLKAFWPIIEERAPFVAPAVVEMSSGNLPPSLRADVVAFWAAHLHGEYVGPYARGLERMDQNAELRARTRDDLIAYFRRIASLESAASPA
ncbi:MAG TPA: M1 family metallopeptidase [Ktedonobacterales bacterium]|nr:M1 family metallopeptidase [Ktedonobacterales bacterium]